MEEKPKTQREIEMARGATVLARRAISQRFNPEHVKDGTEKITITSRERARLDEERKRQGKWREIYEPETIKRST